MEVILLHDVDKVGTRGQIVKVADGFGRNYLLPKKLAVAATPQNRKWVQQQRVQFLKLEAKEKAEAEELAKLFEGVSLHFTRKAGEKGTLFGSVTSLDIAEGLVAKGFHIERRKIQLDAPLKITGEYQVPVKLHREVITHVQVTVEGEVEAPPAESQVAETAPAEPAEGDKPPAQEKEL
jgi:large subunit ribosomal protein L9